jgi:hypothetical protein
MTVAHALQLDGKLHKVSPGGHHYRGVPGLPLDLWDDAGDRCTLDVSRPIGLSSGSSAALVPVSRGLGLYATPMSPVDAACVAVTYAMTFRLDDGTVLRVERP